MTPNAQVSGGTPSAENDCSAAPDVCLGEWDRVNGDFDCGHEYAGEITCDDCKHGAHAKYGTPEMGLDPRFPRDNQPNKTHKCPVCGKQVGPEHFACHSGAAGGRKGGLTRGPAKRRGDSEHYRAMVSKRKDRTK